MSPMRPRKVYPGQAIRAQQHNALRSALPRESPLHIGAQAYQRPDWFIARVMDEGPDAEADYTDERYWVQEHYCWNAVGDMHDRMSFRPVGAQGVRYVTATNLGEIGLLGGRKHTLPSKYISEFYVQVFSVIDRQHPGNIHYFFYGGGCPDAQIADGICWINNLSPDENFGPGGQTCRQPGYWKGDLETRMLIHFTNMMSWPKMLILDAVAVQISGLDNDLGGGRANRADFRAYMITEDFNPCAVTWNTRPASAARHNIHFYLGTDNDEPGDNIGAYMTPPHLGWWLNADYGAAFGIEIRTILYDQATYAYVHTGSISPVLIADIRETLVCPGETTPAEWTTASEPGTSGSTATSGSTTTTEAPSTSTGTTGTPGTTPTPGPTTPTTTEVPPTTTTTEAPTTTTVAETMSHECCDPNAAPVRWGFIVAGLGEGCEPLNVSGVLKWTGTVWAWWDGVLHGVRASLDCYCLEGSPFWEFQVWKGDEAWCAWISWEDHTPDCGVNCDTGGTFTEDCLATGPPCCEDGGATVWPKFP